MGLFDNLIKAKLGKFLRGGGTTLVAVLAPSVAKYAGLELTEEQKIGLSTAVGGAIVWLVNRAKHSFPELAKYL